MQVRNSTERLLTYFVFVGTALCLQRRVSYSGFIIRKEEKKKNSEHVNGLHAHVDGPIFL